MLERFIDWALDLIVKPIEMEKPLSDEPSPCGYDYVHHWWMNHNGKCPACRRVEEMKDANSRSKAESCREED